MTAIIGIAVALLLIFACRCIAVTIATEKRLSLRQEDWIVAGILVVVFIIIIVTYRYII